MKCEKCSKDIPLNAKFCLNCGEKVQLFSDIISGSEVSSDWLINIFQSLGFEIDVNEDGNGFTGIHKDRYNIIINLLKNINVVAIQHNFSLNQKGFFGSGNKLQLAINHANSISWLGIFSQVEDKLLVVSTHFNLTEQISERDIVSFVETFDENVGHIIETSGLSKF